MYCTLLFVLAGYMACLAISGYRAALHLRGDVISQQKRIGRYQISILWNVLSAAAVFIAVILTPITLRDLGFCAPRLHEDGAERVLEIVCFLIAGMLALRFLYQIFAFLFSANFRREQADVLQKRREDGGWYDRVVDNLIPRTRKEKGWFAFSAVTAGISEEIVFHGFALMFPLLSLKL